MLISITKYVFICLVLLRMTSCSLQSYKAEDNRVYLIETNQNYNWYQAWHECASRDMQLVSIDSEAKNVAIIKLLENNCIENLWLGGNDQYSTSRDFERPFYWSATGQQFNFTYWSDNNPNNKEAQEHCVHIWGIEPGYKWNDAKCTQEMGFICEQTKYYEDFENSMKEKCAAFQQSKFEIQQNTALQKILNYPQNDVKELLDHVNIQIANLTVEVNCDPEDIIDEFEKLNDYECKECAKEV